MRITPIIALLASTLFFGCGDNNENQKETKKPTKEPSICECFSMIQDSHRDHPDYDKCKEKMNPGTKEGEEEVSEKLLNCPEYIELLEGVATKANIQLPSDSAQ